MKHFTELIREGYLVTFHAIKKTSSLKLYKFLKIIPHFIQHISGSITRVLELVSFNIME